MFYEMTIEREMVGSNDITKRVKGKYLTDCSLFAEAEYKGMSEFPNYNPDITHIKRSPIREFVNEAPDMGDYTIYDAVIADVYPNPDTGKEKLIKYHVGVYATSVEEATQQVQEYMRQGLEDMRFISIKETQIIEVL